MIVINQEIQDLKDIDKHGVINRRILEFWSKTNPTFAKYYAIMLDETPNLPELLTPTTTLDRDARRVIPGNEEGLNENYRKEKARVPAEVLVEE